MAVCDLVDIRTYSRGHHTFVMVGVHTHIIILQIEGVLTELDMLEFILVEVWPSPQTSVNDMRETLSPSHLRNNNSNLCQQNHQTQSFGCYFMHCKHHSDFVYSQNDSLNTYTIQSLRQVGK